MLYQKKHPRNREGSVLLAVVVMTMVLLCLATICLSVVQSTTKASSRNIQRTQAKITAEAALQEFINGYTKGESGLGTDSNDLFKNLQSIAAGGTKDTPVVFKTSFDGMSDDAFAQQFGETEIHLYNLSGSSFKVEAITTFSTQTQKASITFATTTATQSMPSNTVESKKGNAVGSNQLSMGIEGNLYFENDNHENIFMRISRCKTKSHVYCEMSVQFDDQAFITDVYNKSIDNVYKKENRYFYQAPTCTVDGYASVDNNFYMGTSIGKTDINKVNGTYPSEYDKAHLGGYDGYLCVYKKILAWTGGRWRIGSDEGGDITGQNQMDVFCRGYYDGSLCKSLGSINGVNFRSEILSICGDGVTPGIYRSVPGPYSTYTPKVLENGQDAGQKFFVNGNMHVYKNEGFSPTMDNESELSENGALVIAKTNCNSSSDRSLYITGDLFIDGNIYLINGDKNFASDLIEVGGTVHMSSDSRIYVVTDYVAGSNVTVPAANTFTAADLKAGKVPGFKVGHLDNVDTNVDQDSYGRDWMPAKAYIATTGQLTNSNTRARLKENYEMASSNDIFTMSVNYPGYTEAIKYPGDVAATQKIANKYADAMTRTLDSTYTDKYGNVKQVSQFYGEHAGGGPSGAKPGDIIQINASVRLTSEQALAEYDKPGKSGIRNIYLVNLVDEDIVIAVPFGKLGATFRVLNHYNPKKDPSSKQHYVYFMWYDEDDPEQCWYMNNTSMDFSKDGDRISNFYTDMHLPDGGAEISIPTSDGSDVYKCKALKMAVGGVITDPGTGLIKEFEPGNTRRNKKISFGSQNNPKVLMIADYRLTLDDSSMLKTETDLNDDEKVRKSIEASLLCEYAEPTSTKIDNCIMFLVPDYVSLIIDSGKNGTNDVRVQGVLYAWNSQLMVTYSTGLKWYGQVKVDRFGWTDDATGADWIIDLPMGMGSLQSYAGRHSGGSSSVNKVEIQYYEY